MRRVFKVCYSTIVLLITFVLLSLAFSDASARSEEVGEKNKKAKLSEHMQVPNPNNKDEILRIMQPNGGEGWLPGYLHDIVWYSVFIDSVNIDFSATAGADWIRIVSGTPTEGPFWSWIEWITPNALSCSCLIRICDIDGSPCDQSDSFFTILSSFNVPWIEQRVQREADINMCLTNWGTLGSSMRHSRESKGGCFNPHPDMEVPAPSFEFPSGSGLEYLFGGAVWIGAKINDTVYTSVGYDGWQWIYEMWPDSFPQGAIIERSTIPEAPCYLPDAISNQDIIAVYSDTSVGIIQADPFDNRPHHPLNVRITQKSYSWTIQGFDKFIIAEYLIENIGDYLLSEIYIGFFMDADIMHIDENPFGAYGNYDDITGFLKEYEVFPGDTQEVNIAWAADNDGHGDMDGGYSAKEFNDQSPRSVIGMKLLDSPNPDLQISYNWWVSNNVGIRDWGPWLAENRSVWEAMNPYGSGNLFPDYVLGTPGGDVSKYFIMSNGEIDFDQLYSCVWPDWHPEEGWLPANMSICADLANGFNTHFLFSFGPFAQIAPNDSLIFAVAFVIGETLHVDPLNLAQDPGLHDPDRFYANLNFSSLVQNAQIAQELYNDNFLVFLPADVTNDETVNIADVLYLINFIFIYGPSPSPLKIGDVNRDCVVDIEDVVYLVNYLFLSGPPPQVGCAETK